MGFSDVIKISSLYFTGSTHFGEYPVWSFYEFCFNCRVRNTVCDSNEMDDL